MGGGGRGRMKEEEVQLQESTGDELVEILER